MSNLRNKFILSYLSWTILFAVISIVVVQPEKLTFGMILMALIVSAVLGVPATHCFFKGLGIQILRREDVCLDLLPEEKSIFETEANLKRGIIMLNGFLFLTNKRILFIGTEFFDKNKEIMCLSLDLIGRNEYSHGNKIIIWDISNNKNVYFLNRAFDFHTELNKTVDRYVL